MLAVRDSSESLPEANFKEKVRCGEVYRNLNGNEMFQKFYYRCLECSMDFESSPEFEEHVIVHYLQEDVEDIEDNIENLKNNENVCISISSDEDEEENDYLYAFESVASLVEENVSENDLPLPLMQMLSEQSADSCDKTVQNSGSDDEDEDERNVVFPCEGLRKQALHVFSEHCCTQCPAYFSTKSELIFHLHVHTLPNTVVCPHCYEAFPNILKLNEHSSSTKRKRMRKVKNKDNRDGTTENLQSSKKAKSQIQEGTIQLKEQRDENNTSNCTEYTEKNDPENSLNCELENGRNKTLLEEKDTITSNKDENCRNDSVVNVSIPRKNHISNET